MRNIKSKENRPKINIIPYGEKFCSFTDLDKI